MDTVIPPAQYYSKEQVATMLGISVRTLDRMLAEGKIECSRVGSGRGRVRFTARQLEDFMTLAAVPIVKARRRVRRRSRGFES